METSFSAIRTAMFIMLLPAPEPVKHDLTLPELRNEAEIVIHDLDSYYQDGLPEDPSALPHSLIEFSQQLAAAIEAHPDATPADIHIAEQLVS